MTRNERSITVYLQRGSNVPDPPMGILYITSIRGQEHCSFEFSPEWLKDWYGPQLDPDLFLFSGRQYRALRAGENTAGLFGVFSDSAPDRWGRRLMQRQEALKARQEGRAAQALTEIDYLLGVDDMTRMGALRFSSDKGQTFLTTHGQSPSIPPFVRLRALEEASRNLEKHLSSSQEEETLALLMAPGSSLGGARPKANVQDENGRLWIGKFPSLDDTYDVGAWEMICHELAAEYGLNVPTARVERFSRHGMTFLSQRFDRNSRNERIHFASAMTLLGRTDGSRAQDGVSYLDLVGLITQYGSHPDRDLKELFKRILFNIAVANTDDHLRNHGFILEDTGWTLSPLYDVNPNPYGKALSLNISSHSNQLDFSLAVSQSSFFHLDLTEAQHEVEKVKEVVAKWPAHASKMDIPYSEQKFMASAFLI